MYKNVQLKMTAIALGVISLVNTLNFAQSSANTDKYLYGIASIYEDNFEGKTTASGTVYASNSLTAGHRTLPFGSRIEVENLSNGKKVQVIINDRGPFEKNRILNLSKKSAEILEFISEGSTFVKITILELGASLPSPLGLPEPPIGKDIPQQQPSSTPDPIVDEEISLLDDENLFADLDDEIDFMDEELTNEDSQLKAQALPTTIDSGPSIAPITGFEPTEDILINDPLSNITISKDDEFIAEPLPIIENSAPYELTSEEQSLLEDNASEDPFSDLFNDSSEPFPFQNEVVSTLQNSPLTNGARANNIDGDMDEDKPVIPRLHTQTNTVFVTNFVTNTTEEVVTNAFEQTNTSTPTDEIFDDFYYEESLEETVPVQQTNSTPPIKPEVLSPTNEEPKPIDALIEEPKPVDAPTNEAPKPINAPIEEPKEEQPLEFQKLGDHYIIQLGAFGKQENALKLYENLRSSGFNAYITDVKVKGRNLMRVRVGYFKTIDEASAVSIQLKENHNLDNRIIQVEYEDEKK